jgi:signal transduction histidine kinase
MSTSSPPPNRRSRFISFAIFFIITLILFVGGIAALLYFLFSEYTGVRNIWILICGAPVVLVVVGIFTIFNLYTRYGRPLENLFDTINKIEEGDLSARVKENNVRHVQRTFQTLQQNGRRTRTRQRNNAATSPPISRTNSARRSTSFKAISKESIDGVYQPTPEHINNTLDETRLLTRLVNDLQTLSRSPKAGQLPLHPTLFLLADLIADLTSSFSSQAASLGIHLTNTPRG